MDAKEKTQLGTDEWSNFTIDLDIPARWVDVSYNSDELPSFKTPTGYQVWIDSWCPVIRRLKADAIGFDLESNDLPARFCVMREYDDGSGESPIFCTESFKEVLKFVSNENLEDQS